MIFEVRLSDQAESDLRSIFEYIAFDLQSMQNASSQLRRLEESILSLEQMPDRYRAFAKEPWHSRGLRVMPVDRYLVFYIPNHEEKLVTIIRVLYGGRNVEEQLNSHTRI